MSIQKLEIGSIFNSNTIEQKFSAELSQIRPRMPITGILVLNKMLPRGTKIQFDDLAFELEVFPFQFLRIPESWDFKNKVTITIPAETFFINAGAGIVISDDLAVKLLLYTNNFEPNNIPDSRLIRDFAKISTSGLFDFTIRQMMVSQMTVNFQRDNTASPCPIFWQSGSSDPFINDDFEHRRGHILLRDGDVKLTTGELFFDETFSSLNLQMNQSPTMNIHLIAT